MFVVLNQNVISLALKRGIVSMLAKRHVIMETVDIAAS
jgi:hypothetical protein